jgi:hypothetical protein
MDFDGLSLKAYIMLILKIDDYLYHVPKTRIKYENITMAYTIKPMDDDKIEKTLFTMLPMDRVLQQ